MPIPEVFDPPEELYSLWSLRVMLGNKRIVYRREEGNSCYNNIVFWMYDHIREIEAILERHVNDQPKVIIEDVFVSADN